MIIRQQLIQEAEYIRLVADLEFDPHSPISLLNAGMQACERSQQCRLLLEMPTVGPVALFSKVLLGFGMARLRTGVQGYERERACGSSGESRSGDRSPSC